MQQKIILLKNGALLVRLQTKENSISALREAGNEKVASQVAEKQIAFNKNIISAFRKNFTFCDVYFFESRYSEMVLNGRYDQVVFVNDSLQADPNIKCTKEFLTAEFSVLEADTAAYFESDYFGYGGANKSYHGGPDLGFDVLKIMNNKFVQLRDPFPYYVRTYDPMPVMEKLERVVVKMNKKLNSFYESGKK